MAMCVYVCQRSVISATEAQLDIMNCKSASSSWPCFINTHLLQLHLPAQSRVIRKKPDFCHLLWRTLFKSGQFVFKWERLTMWGGEQVCAILFVLSVCIYACLHVGGCMSLVIRLLSSHWLHFHLFNLLMPLKENVQKQSETVTENMNHTNKKINTAQSTQ